MTNKTLEEAAKNYIKLPLHKDIDGEERYYNSNIKSYDAFIEGAKWQAERMYSEEDLREAIDLARVFSKNTENDGYDEFEYTPIKIIQQFKNLNKMTAVEWFYQRILAKDIKSAFEQAKEMEKEQIENAYDHHRCIGNFDNGIEYYNETYKK